jgi:hypothetical protein
VIVIETPGCRGVFKCFAFLSFLLRNDDVLTAGLIDDEDSDESILRSALMTEWPLESIDDLRARLGLLTLCGTITGLREAMI